MMLFPIYGVLIWWLVFRSRRSWLGLGWLALGEAGILSVAFFHVYLSRIGMIEAIESLQLLLYAYAGLLMVVGVFFFVQPKIYAVRGRHLCRACGYDLVGMPSTEPICPECGFKHTSESRPRSAVASEVRTAQQAKWGTPATEPLRMACVETPTETVAVADSAADRAPDEADAEHEQGQTGDDAPTHAAEIARIQRSNERDGTGSSTLRKLIELTG